jgi:glycosyltransferase involved in cell wall biosynthesis
VQIKIAIIVPAYNEENAIADVITGIRQLQLGNNVVHDVIVVNDASTDHTPQMVSALNCILLDLPVNLGIGGAMQTGFQYAYENDYDYAMQVDGDGQHPACEIPKLVNAILNGNSNVVIGSRFIENKGFLSTFFRRMGITFFKHLLKIFYGVSISDTTSGFRIIDRKALGIVNEYYPDEYPEPESLVLSRKHGLKIEEVAVEMCERQGGRTSIRAFYSLYYMVKVSIAIFFTSIRIKRKNIS